MQDELYTQRTGTRTIPPLVRYFVSVAGTEDHSGPFTLAQLQGAWRRGDIDPESLIWKEGTETWRPVTELKETLEPESFDEYLASPRAGGPDKVRHRRHRRRSHSADRTAGIKAAKRRSSSRRSSRASNNRRERKSTAKQVALIVAILLLAMICVAGMMLVAGRAF